MLLALNAIPWQSQTSKYFYGAPEGFRLDVTSYGWPYSYDFEFSAQSLPQRLPGDLTGEEIEDAELANRIARFHILDNLLIIGLLSLVVFAVFEILYRRLAHPSDLAVGRNKDAESSKT